VYDSWGKLVSITGGNGENVTDNTSHIGYINPLRYRSYYYDSETELYYLNARYYDPETVVSQNS
jgi:RHS repeat-associated protein